MPKPSVNLINPLLRIHDLEQAACLLASGFEPSGHEWAGERLFLLFPDCVAARNVLADLATGALRLDPCAVMAGYRTARRVLYEAKQRRGTLR